MFAKCIIASMLYLHIECGFNKQFIIFMAYNRAFTNSLVRFLKIIILENLPVVHISILYMTLYVSSSMYVCRTCPMTLSAHISILYMTLYVSSSMYVCRTCPMTLSAHIYYIIHNPLNLISHTITHCINAG